MSRFPLLAIAALSVLAGCTAPNSRVASKVNSEAALRGLPMNPQQWKLITSGANGRDATIFTLFGNNTAVQHARNPVSEVYPAGSLLCLVTWHSQEDPRWFGGRIPAVPKALEVVEMRDTGNGRTEPSYSRYVGAPLHEVESEVNLATSRINYLSSVHAAVMP